MAEGCRMQAALMNTCGRPVRYVVVRAHPHPQRGMLPTETRSIGRFRIEPAVFEREMCEQSIRILELAPDGSSRDATMVPMTPAIAMDDLERRAGELNACTARCEAPVTERGAVVAELRQRFRHAMDEQPDGRQAREVMINAVVTERLARERICADVCHGRMQASDVPAAQRAATTARDNATSSAATLLAAIAARPPRAATPDLPPPQAEADDRRPPGVAETTARTASRAVRVSQCRTVRGRTRCTFALRTSTQAATQTRSRRPEARQGQRRPVIRASQRRQATTQQRRPQATQTQRRQATTQQRRRR